MATDVSNGPWQCQAELLQICHGWNGPRPGRSCSLAALVTVLPERLNPQVRPARQLPTHALAAPGTTSSPPQLNEGLNAWSPGPGRLPRRPQPASPAHRPGQGSHVRCETTYPLGPTRRYPRGPRGALPVHVWCRCPSRHVLPFVRQSRLPRRRNVAPLQHVPDQHGPRKPVRRSRQRPPLPLQRN